MSSKNILVPKCLWKLSVTCFLLGAIAPLISLWKRRYTISNSIHYYYYYYITHCRLTTASSRLNRRSANTPIFYFQHFSRPRPNELRRAEQGVPRRKADSRPGIHSGSVRPDYHLQAEIVTIKLAFTNPTACQFIGNEPRRPASTEQRTSQQTVLRIVTHAVLPRPSPSCKFQQWLGTFRQGLPHKSLKSL